MDVVVVDSRGIVVYKITITNSSIQDSISTASSFNIRVDSFMIHWNQTQVT